MEQGNRQPERRQSPASGPNCQGSKEWQVKNELRITDILFAVRKHIVLIVVCAIIGLIAGVGLSIVSYMKGEINKQYAITTAIAVTSQNADGLFTARSSNPDSQDIYLAENMVDSVIFVLKSDKTLEAAVKRLDLLGVSTRDIANNLSMAQYNGTQVIQITLYWRSAQEGVEILTAINEVAPAILIETLKIGGVSVINEPRSKYLIGGNINASMWLYMMILGGVFGAGFAVLELLIRPTLLSAKDMETLFSLEILGAIPSRKAYFKKKRNLLLENEDDETNADISDNYSSIAHILKSRIKNMQHTCVYITSATQSEGKTTVTSRLAVQMSGLGMKVLLIDCDTRNPKLGGLFLNKVEYEHSINALYRGEVSKEDAITHLTGNLDILPAILERRPLPFDDALFELVANLKQEYDVIFMDTAPVGQVADTMSLNLLADIALLVVRFDGASMEVISDAIGRLNKSGTQIIGCIINAEKRLSRKGYYGYGYGYGYGGYGAERGKYGSHGSSGKPHRKRQKSEQELEWENWDKKHAEQADYFEPKVVQNESEDRR